MRSPCTAGTEVPFPGRGTFQRVFSALSFSGYLPVVMLPLKFGPRQFGQDSLAVAARAKAIGSARITKRRVSFSWLCRRVFMAALQLVLLQDARVAPKATRFGVFFEELLKFSGRRGEDKSVRLRKRMGDLFRVGADEI